MGISGDGAHASSSQEVLKVKEHTKHNTTITYASVRPHTKNVQLEGEPPPPKNAVSVLIWKFGRGHVGTEQGTSVVSGEGQVQ